ncbi:hypothetical protein [Nocardioides humi]|uniref:Uncharacterized protein n=1 Tax=Nocardioides humi TaxID=449461 RepID=A0ABN2BM56_9ACTN|nr:hypothetical protein [Nocardioides humi]
MGRVVTRYDYTDEKGRLRFCKVRLDPKDFRWGKFLRWEGDTAVLTKGIPAADAGEWGRVIYKLQEVAAALRADVPLVICEGEKDSDNLTGITGMTSTSATNPVRPRVEQAEWFVRFNSRSDLLIAADQDVAGARSAWRWYQNLREVGAEQRRITVITPKRRRHKDVTDVLDAGLRLDGFRVVDLDRLERAATQYAPGGGGSVGSSGSLDADEYDGLARVEGLGWVNANNGYVVQFDPGIRNWRPTLVDGER